MTRPGSALFGGGCIVLLISWACAAPPDRNIRLDFSLRDTVLMIPQVDYEKALYSVQGSPYIQLDVRKVQRDEVIEKEHVAIIMENEYVKLTLLPEMGRVYSFIPKSTGHEVFWHNDTVTVGGGQQNSLGWWIWIGGAEYTLPGDEHGTTWAEQWTFNVVEDTEHRKAVRMSVKERGTGLEEHIEIVLYPDRSFYEARIEIVNPTSETVQFAHWINPQWTPGGRNELTDNTEFIIPTRHILIPDRFRERLGESRQDWRSSRLRFIQGWDRGSGDLMADGLEHGFYGAYSHDEEEGVVRVFDKEITPGVDVWTYGYKPRFPQGIPMGSGRENDGYVEMWGGTSRVFPDERHPIRPGETLAWTEWMYPFRGTGGLSYANEDVALHLERDSSDSRVRLGIAATREFRDVRATMLAGADTLLKETFAVLPGEPVRRVVIDLTGAPAVQIKLEWEGQMLMEVTWTW
jgi:hypothetical protein